MKSIGRYLIRATLGRGSMGSVYKVVVPGLDKIAALKTLQPSPQLVEKMGIDRLRRQFVREAAIIANARHPNIVEVWSLEEEGRHLFYLMEYFCHNLGSLIGETYWADAATRVVRTNRAAALINDVLEGLHRLHLLDVVHRDIKPFNIMLTDEGAAKIVDFGLSQRRGESPLLSGDIVVGTKSYAAPEQIAAPDESDHRSDLYAVGVMLYRMLTGRLPQEDPLPPSKSNPELDGNWDAFLLQSIAPDPRLRFADAQAMAGELRRLFAAHRQRKIEECRLDSASPPPQPAAKPSSPTVMVRSQAGRILSKHARATFDLDDLYRPKRYLPKQLVQKEDGTVVDKASRLVWQRSGSEYPLPWDQAEAYTQRLNAENFGGYADWRMPTVNELLSLLDPPPPEEDSCLDSRFSKQQKWIWSGDSRSKKAFWSVDMEMGCVASHDRVDFLYAKGVCDL